MGVFRYKCWSDSKAIVQVDKPDGLTVRITYEKGKATARWISLPEGHPLKGRIQPPASGRTLEELTQVFPTLVAIAKGKRKDIPDSVREILAGVPSDRYRLALEEEAGRFHLHRHENLYLQGYDPRPHAKIPYLAYWGPELGDGLGDDSVYVGEWVLDQYRQNLPLEIRPNNLHSVKAGDTIDYAGRKVHIEYIDWDNDGNPWNNSMIVRIDGHAGDLSQITKSAAGGKPVAPERFVQVVCWPSEASMPAKRTAGPVSGDEFRRQLSLMAQASSERDRGNVVRDILQDAEYQEIHSASNGYGDSEDIWVVKPGQSELTVIITAHYDKAGEDSQGIHDNGCGVVVTAAMARALRHVRTQLTYVFLFYGAHEVDGHNWSVWLTRGNLKTPIKYVIEAGGGGLVGATQTFRLSHYEYTGWLDWRFPTLKINETGGPRHYLKHTATDNLDLCDFSRLVQSQDNLLRILLAVENSPAH